MLKQVKRNNVNYCTTRPGIHPLCFPQVDCCTTCVSTCMAEKQWHSIGVLPAAKLVETFCDKLNKSAHPKAFRFDN